MLNSLDKESTIAMFSILCTMLTLAILINWAHVWIVQSEYSTNLSYKKLVLYSDWTYEYYILINVGILDIKKLFLYSAYKSFEYVW